MEKQQVLQATIEIEKDQQKTSVVNMNMNMNKSTSHQSTENEKYQNNQDQQITQETIQQFNKINIQATELMNAYKTQTQELKGQIMGMVNIYNQNAQPGQAVPVQKIMEITSEYEIGMKEVQKQYSYLSDQLKRESEERDEMMIQIQDCFTKLQRMQAKMRQKNLLKKKVQTSSIQNGNQLQKQPLKQKQKQLNNNSQSSHQVSQKTEQK